jgi:hypothetical protein
MQQRGASPDRTATGGGQNTLRPCLRFGVRSGSESLRDLRQPFAPPSWRTGATVQPFLDVRTAVLNDTLEDAFRHRYPGCHPANANEAVTLAA